MKMEILLEPTLNKLLVGDLCDSTRIKLVSTRKEDSGGDSTMLKSLLNIYDLDCGGWWVALGIASSIGLGKKFTLGKLNCGYQWRPTGKKFALGELCPLTKLSVKCRPLVSGLRLFKTYDGESFKAQELCRKVHWDSQIRE
ncbi:hypothetical protein Tco_0411361 [Tanacetum coccineum]